MYENTDRSENVICKMVILFAFGRRLKKGDPRIAGVSVDVYCKMLGTKDGSILGVPPFGVTETARRLDEAWGRA
jgi:hypothetical protein